MASLSGWSLTDQLTWKADWDRIRFKLVDMYGDQLDDVVLVPEEKEGRRESVGGD